MEQNPKSLIARTTDALYNYDLRLFNITHSGTAYNFLVMPNLLIGFDPDKGCKQWDLKPRNYVRADLIFKKAEKLLFHAGGLKLCQKYADELFEQIRQDTEWLASYKIVDYSLLLGIFPRENYPEQLPEPQNFRTGVLSGCRKYIIKLSIIDYLFSHENAPKSITNASKFLPKNQQFTFTDDARNYAYQFCLMIKDYVQIVDCGETKEAVPMVGIEKGETIVNV
jgi:hypothetical protein